MSGQDNGSPEKETGKKLFAGKPGPGRPKGVPNKNTTLLKDALLQAAQAAGGEGGLVGYLTTQAMQNPQSFLPLLGKVLPLQLASVDEEGKAAPFRIELVGVLPQ